MRVLLTSDWHRDVSTGELDRYDEVSRAIDDSVEYAIGAECQAYIFAGDLTDPDSGAKTHRAIADTIRVAARLHGEGIASFWLVGNHDVMEDGKGSHTLLALQAAALVSDRKVGRIEVVSRPCVFNVLSQLALVCLPYASEVERYDPAAYIEALRGVSIIKHARHTLVVGHMTRIPGYPDGSETTVMQRGRDMTFPVEQALTLKPGATTLANGHYHQRNVTGSVMVPGSIVQVDHGEEAHEPGWLLIDTGD